MDFQCSQEASMRELVQQKDWSKTPLGPMTQWSPQLKTTVQLCLMSKFPSVIFWGDALIQIYNDGYRDILGSKHPLSLGQSVAACWSEVWPRLKPMMSEVFTKNEAIWVEESLFDLERNGYVEESYFTFSFTPILDNTNKVGGILQTVSEVTQQIIGHRRLIALRELGDQPTNHTLDECCQVAVRTLAKYPADLPFVLLYLLDSHSSKASLAAQAGISLEHPGCLSSITFEEKDPWCMQDVIQKNSLRLLQDIQQRFAAFPGGPWQEATHTAVVLPLTVSGKGVQGICIAGISPRRLFDETYADFSKLLMQQLSGILSRAVIYEQEQHKMQKLTELDQVKTSFFHNVSHEFRTPLTLILGPLQDAMTKSTPLLEGSQLEAVNRNALRLLRLVNGLLDFARIESNTGALRFAPLNLAEVTTDIASSFRSLVEQAGLKFTVDCPNTAELIYIDMSKWEVIILNLLSNAFKFTLQGEIAVRLQSFAAHVELTIQDTGAGIPDKDQGNIFKRFHRVQQTPGRSFEGTGIGLSLVHELIKKHGGTIHFTSVENQGTQFTIKLLKGTAHLPADCLIEADPSEYNKDKIEKYIEELSQQLPTSSAEKQNNENEDEALSNGSSRLLIVDDNADMLAYLENILSNVWKVSSAVNGELALKSALESPPDLILSDIMMPVMNGVDLLQKIRADARTREIPFIFLSARAGEESFVENIELGADDYVMKPFSARELRARVKTHLNISKLRKKWAQELVHINQELEAFSYSVSHDLRAPLRAIDGFSKIILQEHGQSLSTEVNDFFKRIRTATVRMGGLIDDLLNLSRITRSTIKRAMVNVSQLANTILSELATKDSLRTVELEVDANIQIECDPHLFEILLQNLLSNAWKFTAKTEKAKIKVGKDISPKENNRSIYYIEDNGAGFDMKHAQKIFTPFQRFHSNDDFEGTGIGLAIVQRIVKKHKGDIWVTTQPGKGTKFSFTVGEYEC